MNQDFLQEERLPGYPAFACRADDAGTVNWWAPIRTGDPSADYDAGAAHFRSTLGLVQVLRQPDFYRHMIVPGLAHLPPCAVLASVLNAMRGCGPIELGFIHGLARQAVAGRLPTVLDENVDHTDDNHIAITYACSCIELARAVDFPESVADELVSAIDGGFIWGTPGAFIWTVCTAAAAGALN